MHTTNSYVTRILQNFWLALIFTNIEEQEILYGKGLSEINKNFTLSKTFCVFISSSHFCIHRILSFFSEHCQVMLLVSSWLRCKTVLYFSRKWTRKREREMLTKNPKNAFSIVWKESWWKILIFENSFLNQVLVLMDIGIFFFFFFFLVVLSKNLDPFYILLFLPKTLS